MTNVVTSRRCLALPAPLLLLLLLFGIISRRSSVEARSVEALPSTDAPVKAPPINTWLESSSMYEATEAACITEAMKKLLRGDNISIAVSGGSVTSCRDKFCWPRRLESRLSASLRQVEQIGSTVLGHVTVHNGAKGSTNSFWHTLLQGSTNGYQKYDVYIWEFSINDPMDTDSQPVQIAIALMWVNAVTAHNPHATVVFVFVWKHPEENDVMFDLTSKSLLYPLMQQLQSRAGVPVEFVSLGHMSNALGTFRGILEDKHHPTRVGHWLISDSLSSVFMKRLASSVTTMKDTPDIRTCARAMDVDFNITFPKSCTEDNISRLVLDRVIHTPAGEFGSKLCEKPSLNGCKNTQVIHESYTNRIDTQAGRPVPTCGEGLMEVLLNNSKSVDLVSFFIRRGRRGMKGEVQVTAVNALGEAVPLQKQMVSDRCFLHQYHQYFSLWLQFESSAPPNIRLRICVMSNPADDPGAYLSWAVWF